MSASELALLAHEIAADPIIFPSVEMFGDDLTDRTLLYGYDVDRHTWHIYSHGGEVILHVYKGRVDDGQTMRRWNLTSMGVRKSDLQTVMIPNKRLYPQQCDYQFCRWAAVKMGLHLSFTSMDLHTPVMTQDGYYGLA